VCRGGLGFGEAICVNENHIVMMMQMGGFHSKNGYVRGMAIENENAIDVDVARSHRDKMENYADFGFRSWVRVG
jgi:hypothetical protein